MYVYIKSRLKFLDEQSFFNLQMTSAIFQGSSPRKCCITISYHTIENTVNNTINAAYARGMMERSGVIPSRILIGCIFYGMV